MRASPPSTEAAPILEAGGIPLPPLPPEGRQRRLDFALNAGEVVGVTGPNASGKSLLLHCLAGQVEGGDLSLACRGVSAETGHGRRLLRENVGIVFQNPGLLRDRSIAENTALPALLGAGSLGTGMEDRVRFFLRLCGFGTHASLEARPAEIGDADLRSAALARALLGGPTVLLLDSLLEGLNRQRRALLAQLLADLMRAQVVEAMVLVTEEESLLRGLCTHVLDMGRECVEKLPQLNPSAPA